MSDSHVRQAKYWNAQAQAFQQIYARDKPGLPGLLDRVFRRDMYERFEFAMDASDPVAGRTFLDVGCGSGVYCLALARRGAARVTGLDIADAMLDLCRAAAEREGLGTGCDFVRAELMQVRPDVPFDVTLGIGLFDYVADPLPLLRKMREVTRDRVILSFPRLGTWRAPVPTRPDAFMALGVLEPATGSRSAWMARRAPWRKRSIGR